MKNKEVSMQEVVFKTASSNICALTFDQSLNNTSNNNIILFLHGWLDNAASFTPLFEHIQEVEKEGFKVIAIDLPGHGASSHKSKDAHYHFIDWVYDILLLLESNGWENVHIVGHSMGGMIASTLAASFPEKVKSITLIDSIGVIHNNEQETSIQIRKGMLSRLKKTSTNNKKLTVERATQARVLISDLEYHNAELIVSRNIFISDGAYKWRSDRRLNNTSPNRFTLAQCKQLVSDIKVPVQIIYGSKGLVFIRNGIEEYAPLMSCKKIVELDGGHHIHMEKPLEVAKLINEFILSI